MTVKLPPKTAGEHRWVALCTFTLTAGQAAQAARNNVVKLGPHNLVASSVGCFDCERMWPAPERCTAAAAPEGMSITGTESAPEVSDEDRERLYAAVDMVQRSGGKAFEVGFLDEKAPAHLARWYASATFKGAKVIAEEHASAVNAAEDLAWKLLEGGKCNRCGDVISLLGHAQPEGVQALCCWGRRGDMWLPGCLAEDEVPGYIAERRRIKR